MFDKYRKQNKERISMEKRISGHTGLLALIGSPVGHSGSPAMYNYSFEKLGLDYAYVAFDIKEDKVKDAIAAMKTFNMRGCNVTMPDKVEAAKYMDELSTAAQIIGAVNTIVNDNGKLTGYITDGEGFVHNLRDHGIEIKGRKITVAGGGGAATAIQVQCALDGAREISIFNIKDAFFERTLQTAEKIRKAVPECVVNVYDIADTAKMTEEIQSSDIFANATIVGMKPMDDQSVVKDLSAFRPGLVVADAVYNPEETKLLREAKEAGCTCIGGKGMLLWQGVAAFKLYTGQDMPVEDVKKLEELILNEFSKKSGVTNEAVNELMDKFKLLLTMKEDEAERFHTLLYQVSSVYRSILREIRLRINLLPPSASMAGLYTMVDNTRGVWKAPANISINNVVTPALSITNAEQEDLNVPMNGKAVNAIRSFPGEGIKVWGARTMDGNSLDWRYINVRRTMIFLEESIKNAARAYVFEPNVANTWVNMRSMIDGFLRGVWKRGGLAGTSPEDAYSIHIGLGDTMTPEDILEGILRISVFVAITRPAEFIEITFQQQMQKS